MKFDNNTGEFTAAFKFDSSVDAPTVLHVLNESVRGEPAWYPDGAKLFLTNEDNQPIDPSLVTYVDPAEITNRIAFKLDPSLGGKLIQILV